MTIAPAAHEIYIETPPAYREDRMFDLSNTVLNRDDSLLPYTRVRQAQEVAGRRLRTADYLPAPGLDKEPKDYYSLGVLENVRDLALRPEIRMRAFLVLEPPVVDPSLYRALPELTAAFERVYVHNTEGDGYSLEGVDTAKLRKLYWPQPRRDVIEPFWSRSDRMDRIVVINGNHVPRKVPKELYSKRIEAMVELAKLQVVDLYGRGWTKLKSRTSFWWPFISRRGTILSIYKGACESKYEVLSQYKFCLCFENMAMKGYITEKIFDCFYAGTIPFYLGATDISEHIPSGAYIDCRQFESWSAIRDAMRRITPDQLYTMRKTGRDFIRSEQGRRFSESLERIFGPDHRGETVCQ